MARVEIRIDGRPVEDWLAGLSESMASAQFTLLASQDSGDTLREIIDVRTESPATIVERLCADAHVTSHDVLHREHRRLLVQFQIPISETYAVLRRAGIPPHYPVHLQAGWYTHEFSADQDRIDEYVAGLREANIPFEVLSVRDSPEQATVLTDRQQEFLSVAIEHGFYETPRECTLTELAEVFEINASALSRLRHRTESRLVHAFMASGGGS